MPDPAARRFDHCIDDLYAGVTDAGRFARGMATAGRLFDATGVTYLRVDDKGELCDMVAHGHDPEILRLFVDHYQRHDPTKPIVLAMRPGEWFQDDRVLDPRSPTERGYVNDFAPRAGIRWFRGGKVVENRRGAAVITVQRPADAAPFDGGSLALLDRLRPHLARISLLKAELAPTLHLLASTRSALDTLGAGVCLVDKDCRLVYANPAAERLFSQSGAVGSRADTLTCRGAAMQSRLKAEVAAAIEAPRRASAFCPNPDADWDDRVRIRVLPCGAEHPTLPVGRGRLALLFLIRGVTPLHATELAAAFGWTRSEAELVALLAQGHPPAICAERRHVAISTIRTQLKSIYLKTGVDSLARLLPLVLAMPGLSGES